MSKYISFINSISYFKGTSWKKFTYQPVDYSTGELLNNPEEISFQASRLPNLLVQRPELLLFLAKEIQATFTNQFPNTSNLIHYDMQTVVDYALKSYS